ncbi:MAG TPA: tRNA (adenosine(37)-N6)-threonylcarbamoyltransferase complex dimerization subunit type 1 TsaB [Terriglobales bacterium]|jgi:tRNA threonylcarbamoyladenosine biosynthesis protein TsaB|nr:tRNA (adenosine(37)-N6)-threonylcarbamoyltransferase complex dimerization subunit type 1 TsaB [Terriglobales bacterium]
MLLLAVDTSGKNGSLALARVTPGQSEIDILETIPLTGGAFSAQLVPLIAASLEKHGHSKRDLGAFAVVSGPGSFTGLRVGLAAIKGLAEALEKPIVAVSLLEAVAHGSALLDRVFAVLDAERSDVYVGDYDLGSPLSVPSERLLGREELLAEAKSQSSDRLVVTPDATLVSALRAGGIRVELIEYPSSAVIARLGWEHLQHGQIVRPADLEANYIRRSDAEIFAKPR